MRALVVRGGGRLEIGTVPDPTPGPGELVLRVDACGICGTDLHMVAADAFPDGTVPGHEFSGEVVDSAHGFRAGERVCALPALSCGSCARCRIGLGAYCERQRTAGLGTAPGAFAEYVAVAAHESLRLSRGVGPDLGALVEPLAVALHGVRVARLRRGETCLVLGGGPIGLAAALWAAHFGARRVLVSEPAAARRALAETLGATAVAPEALADTVARELPDGPDVVVEAVGAPGLIQEACETVRFRGRVVVAGVCMGSDSLTPLPAILREATAHFVMAYEKDDFQYTVDMLEAGRVDPLPLVTGRVALDALPAAFEALARDPAHCKVLYQGKG